MTSAREKPRYITLREAGAMIMNPDNPQASYAQIDAATERTKRIYIATQRISRLAGIIAALVALHYFVVVPAQPASWQKALSLALFLAAALTAMAMHPYTLSKSFVGALLIPKGPEPIEDLLGRLGRGEFAAHWGEDGHPMVALADVRTVIADRQADAARGPSNRSAVDRVRVKPIDRSIRLTPDKMSADTSVVEPATLAELNAAPSGSFVKINTAYAFILGGGDPVEGAALLRRLERESNSVIRQPDSQYLKVSSLRAFLKEQAFEGAGGSPWDAL